MKFSNIRVSLFLLTVWISSGYCTAFKQLSAEENISKGYVFYNFSQQLNVTVTDDKSHPGYLNVTGHQLVAARDLDLDNDTKLCHDQNINFGVSFSDGTTMTFLVIIKQADEFEPKFPNLTYNTSVSEFSRPGTIVWDCSSSKEKQATDKDCGESIYYDVNDTNFKMDKPRDGIISTKTQLQYDHDNPVKVVKLKASSGPASGPYKTVTTEIRIKITDEDDHDPAFRNKRYTLNVKENNRDVKWITTNPPIEAFDQDLGINEKINYSFAKPLPLNIEINETNGQIKLKEPLDREKKSTYLLYVQAYQSDGNRGTATATLTINVDDVNDNRPLFDPTEYSVTLAEHTADGTPVAIVTATDADVGENARFNYTISRNYEGAFSVDRDSGVIKVINSSRLDRERDPKITITVTTTEQTPIEGPTCNSSCTATIAVTLTDINDNAPQFEEDAYHFSLAEGASVGSFVGSVKATDGDLGVNGEIQYSLLGSLASTTFSVNKSTGDIRLKTPIDTNQDVVEIIVKATDNGKPALESSVSVKIIISSKNGAVPIKVPVIKERLEKDKDSIESDLSRIIDVDVTIVQINRTYSLAEDSSMLYISAKNNSKPLSTNELSRLVHNKYEDISALWERYKEDPPPDNNNMINVSIALMVIAGIVLLVAVICFGVICLKNNSYKKKNRVYEKLNSESCVHKNKEEKTNQEEETSDYSRSGSLTTEQLAANGDVNERTICINLAYEPYEEVQREADQEAKPVVEEVVQEAVINLGEEDEEVRTWCSDHRESEISDSILTTILTHSEQDLDGLEDDSQLVLGHNASRGEEQTSSKNPDVSENDITTTPEKRRSGEALPPPPPVSPLSTPQLLRNSSEGDQSDPFSQSVPELKPCPDDVPTNSPVLPPTPPRLRKHSSEDLSEHPLDEPEPDYAKKVRFAEAKEELKKHFANNIRILSTDAESGADPEQRVESNEVRLKTDSKDEMNNLDAEEEITAF